MSILEKIEVAPTNEHIRDTNEQPANWIVFTVANPKDKRQYVRIHPDYVLEVDDFRFTEECLKNFQDAWGFIVEGEIEESRFGAVRPYVTFILNKVAHLYLESREVVAEMIQSGELTLIDSYITNNQEILMIKKGNPY